jgi:hypothetical protein
MKTKKDPLRKIWPEILITLCISILIPLILYLFKLLDEYQSILFGAMLSIISTTIEILGFVKIIYDRERSEIEVLSIKDNFANKLVSIQQSFGRIVDKRYGDKDLFIEHFDNVVSGLEAQISKCDAESELVTDRRHFSNSALVLESFEGNNSDIIRAVYFLKNNSSFLRNDLSRAHFISISKLVPKKIREVRRLFVVSDDEELNSQYSINIIRFHVNTPGYSYQLIKSDIYLGLHTNELQGSPDFVLYGDKYLFYTQHETIEETLVTWSKDRESIQSNTLFFDKMWFSDLVYVHDNRSIQEPISVSELFR